MSIIETIKNIYSSGNVSASLIISTLLMSLLLGLYECLAYRFASRKSLQNKSYYISIITIPCFISTIVLCLQSDIVITLGTIGALAIIRFRTAVKDPIDMMYLFWSIHSGIMIGCQLYRIAVMTSLLITVVLLGFSLFNLYTKQYSVIIKTKSVVNDDFIFDLFRDNSKSIKIEARNYSSNGYDYIISAKIKKMDDINIKLSSNNVIEKYSILENNG